jgi:hypothetical protein
MPYINKESREQYKAWLDQMPACICAGNLNYLISMICHKFVLKAPKIDYALLNLVVGVLDSAKAEFQRVVVAPYEERKIEQNGPISELDT